MITKLRGKDSSYLLRLMMSALTIAFLIGAICAGDRSEMFAGLGRIVSKPSLLTKDYFYAEIGSVSGAMFNTFLVGAVCCAMMYLKGASVAGGTVAAYFLTIGFSFFGINILNILPFVFGTLVYSAIKQQSFAKNINFAMFSTALAPLASEVMFRYPSAEAHGISFSGVMLAVAIGLVVGITMPALCAHAQSFHKGYDLYNAGPAAGFLCFVIYCIMYKAIGVSAPEIKATLGEGSRLFCNVFAIACFALCLIFGLAINGGFKGYGKLLLDPGHKVDFAQKHGIGPCLINVGVYGLFIVAYYNLIGATFTGPTFGVIWCMLAFCAAGSTPLNVLPIMIGYFLASLFGATVLNAQAIVVGLCFASGLAPISGHYGPIAGIAAGVLHYCTVTSVPAIHGGFNLYNGGFTSGLVAFVMVPVLESFFKTIQARKNKA